jgi:hypothetical protein
MVLTVENKHRALENEPLQNFITSEIGDVLNEDKQLRKGLFS